MSSLAMYIELLRIGCDTSPQEVGMRKPTQALGLISAAASNASSARVE